MEGGDGGEGRAWLTSGWGTAAPVADGPVSNYYEDQKLMEGPLIKLGDYAHFRYFLLYRNGRFCYYELPMPKEAPADNGGGGGGGAPRPARVHVTLTPQHLRGVMMLNASLIAKELQREPDDEYDVDAIHRGMAFNRKKRELNLTGYSLTGQLTSWKLRAANEGTYVKWEKAFRLALRPIWIQNTPQCLICRQEYSLLFRPHHCRKCGTCMCDECSVFVPRLPMQGYYDVVRICRDCGPVKIRQSELKTGVRVLVYGIYPGKIAQLDLTDDSERGGAFVNVEMEREIDGERPLRRVALHFVELYSDAILSANRIKSTIRRHLAQALFRAQLNFSTWNSLETVQEQKTVQMVRILNKSTSITELKSMVPTLGSLDTVQYTADDVDEQGLVRESLSHYRGVHISFPLRLETVMKLIDQFRCGVLLHRVFLYQILEESQKLFARIHQAPMNTVLIPAGVSLIVVGDLHGQLEDLLTIWDKNGVPSQKTWYLFNGDFVDRGSHGVEVMTLLLIFKVLYPEYVFLNRGNHEERMINENFGFEDEIYVKYSSESMSYEGADVISCSPKYSCVKLFQMFEEVFLTIPIFSVINERVFITHGGLSSHENVTLDELQRIRHQREVPTQGTSREDELFTHLLWSDPRNIEGHRPSDRGAGVEFGPDITRQFCTLNQISLIVRSHECQEEGYEITHDGMILTIFSASSYCGSQTNKGAFVQLQVIENGNLKPHVVQYYSQPLQKLRDAGKNEWRKKAVRLERRTVMSMAELIREKSDTLAAAFGREDPGKSGFVSKIVWRTLLREILGIDVRFLSYFRQLVPQDCAFNGLVNYHQFLDHYASDQTIKSTDGFRHLLRRVWLAFCDTLEREGIGELASMSSVDKLQAAFDLFKSSKFSSAQADQTNSQSLSPVHIESIRGIATQRSHANFFSNGLITYDVFRATLQNRVGLTAALTEQQILDLMQQIDQNSDGFVDFDEFRSFFLEFYQSDRLQELFDLNDMKAIDLLQQFGSLIAEGNEFSSLRDAFHSFDRRGAGILDTEDILDAARTIRMVPQLDPAGAKTLHDAILRAYYGSDTDNRTLNWVVFDDVFSPDSTRQRSLRIASLNESSTNFSGRKSGHVEELNTGTDSPSSRLRLTSVDACNLETLALRLCEHHLHLKFVFRILDKRHCGYLSRSKFLAAVKCVNNECGNPVDEQELETVADAFCVPQQRLRTFSDVSDDNAPTEIVFYPSFLNHLRTARSESKSTATALELSRSSSESQVDGAVFV